MIVHEQIRATLVDRVTAGLVLAGHMPLLNFAFDAGDARGSLYRGPLILFADGFDDSLLADAWRLCGLAPAAVVPTRVGYVGTVVVAAVCDAMCITRLGRWCGCGPWARTEAHHWLVTSPTKWVTPLRGKPKDTRLWDPPRSVVDTARGIPVVA